MANTGCLPDSTSAYMPSGMTNSALISPVWSAFLAEVYESNPTVLHCGVASICLMKFLDKEELSISTTPTGSSLGMPSRRKVRKNSRQNAITPTEASR